MHRCTQIHIMSLWTAAATAKTARMDHGSVPDTRWRMTISAEFSHTLSVELLRYRGMAIRALWVLSCAEPWAHNLCITGKKPISLHLHLRGAVPHPETKKGLVLFRIVFSSSGAGLPHTTDEVFQLYSSTIISESTKEHSTQKNSNGFPSLTRHIGTSWSSCKQNMSREHHNFSGSPNQCELSISL